eukprot:2912539-Prymnesium_polylepis.1
MSRSYDRWKTYAIRPILMQPRRKNATRDGQGKCWMPRLFRAAIRSATASSSVATATLSASRSSEHSRLSSSRSVLPSASVTMTVFAKARRAACIRPPGA